MARAAVAAAGGESTPTSFALDAQEQHRTASATAGRVSQDIIWAARIQRKQSDQTDGNGSGTMERASSPACSSSSSSALFVDGWFPSNLKGEPMKLLIRSLPYHAHVEAVDQEEPVWSTVFFKTAKKCPTRFFVGDVVKLESRDRRSWSGEVITIEDDVTQLWTTLKIRVPPARESKIVLKSANNVLVMVNPVGSLSGFSSQTELRDSTNDPREETRIRVGINGFSQVGRILVEMGLQSIDVQVVAINDPSMTLDRMVEIWKSTNIGIAKRDHQTLVFEKKYYAKPKNTSVKEDEKIKINAHTSVKEDEKIKINALLEQMEVTVFREQNQVPWERVDADFVVEYNVMVDDKAQISDKNENWNSCLRCLPEEIKSYGLHVDEPVNRLHFSTDNGENATRAATFSIVTKSTVAAKAVCKVFKGWDEQSTSLFFHANAVVDKPVGVDDSSVDLKVTLEKAEGCSGTNSIATSFCADDKEVAHRLKGIFGWCVDIVRCVPVGGCRLELV